jgi:hypothetical protein
MQNLTQPRLSRSTHFNYSAQYAAERVEHRAGDTQASHLRQADHQFVQMLNGFRESGGLARLQEVAQLCACRGRPDIETLSTNLGRKEIICFEWQSHAWLPLFQFNISDMRLCSQVQPVISELSCIYDPWELAFWFSQPNAWLANRAPADALLSDPATVLQAARADRFVAD